MNGKHSWNDFGCRISEREIGQPEKKRIVETVPYSNDVQNFNTLYGMQVYGERDLRYQLVLMDNAENRAQKTIRKICAWLNVSGYVPLYDDMMPAHYFLAEPLAPKVQEKYGLYLIEVKFKAAPYIYPITPKLPYDPTTYPDLDGDGVVTSADAAIIMTAATAISAGNASGLTPEQEVLADADRDGAVTALDAAIVLEYATATSVGTYANTPEGWAEFMNGKTSQKEGIL